MNEIQLHDKHFEVYIPSTDILEKVAALAVSIEKDYQGKNILFLSILNGAFMFSSDLMKAMHSNVEISFIKVSSYHGTNTSGRVDELIGLNAPIKGRDIIILEDIVDTGITIDKVMTLLKASQANSIAVCSLLYKPSAFQGKEKPNYIGFEIPNDFVVGYGLDYDQLGRNLSSIYQLKK
jgi:phosphoribosylpyrophosphate synthetase